MDVSYNKFYKMLIDRKMKKKDICEQAGIATSTRRTRMNNNLYHEKYDGSNEAEVFRHEVIMDLVFLIKNNQSLVSGSVENPLAD